MKRFGLVLVVMSFTYLSVHYLWNEKILGWKKITKNLVLEIQESKFERSKLEAIQIKAKQKLPSIYPFNKLSSLISEGLLVLASIENLKTQEINFTDKNEIKISFDSLFKKLSKLENSLKKIQSDLQKIPAFALEENENQQREALINQIKFGRESLQSFAKFQKAFESFSQKEKRILILLQNQNERRPTGGFVGSFILIDFATDTIEWKFSDIYQYDRLVETKDQLPAPDFFHPLSKKISLRDANFWPHFPTSAQKYQTFFEKIGQKSPDIVVALNLNIVEPILSITGPIKFEDWGITLDQYNFDLGLQFLVESKISGRYEVKKPLNLFIKKVGTALQKNPLTLQRIFNTEMNWKAFFDQKNILAYSKDKDLEAIFDKWGISGKLRKQKNIDNFLFFDFISIGANKSDKFIWQKIWHNSQVLSSGEVINEIKIKRTHSLKKNEIQTALKAKNLSQNIRELLTSDLLWKMGAGENRTIMRIYVPMEAKILKAKSPSGKIKSYLDSESIFRIIEVPIYTLPGETSHIAIRYKTQIERGAQDWRPYALEVLGTPGLSQTEFLETVAVGKNGQFEAETKNIGQPQNLLDAIYRSVILFDLEA